MKRMLIFILVLCSLLLIACEEGDVAEVVRSECDSYSDGPRKVMCYAIEAKSIEMCDPVVGRFRDSCYLALAELIDDPSKVSECEKMDVEDQRKICRALVLEDGSKCLAWEAGEGLGSALKMRDCIDLVARKLGDSSICDMHKGQEVYTVCGKTGDCEGQFLDSGKYNAEDCVGNIR
ncbi:hypothetical protein ACFL0V_03760 [Nanoarchaeota archaeon]